MQATINIFCLFIHVFHLTLSGDTVKSVESFNAMPFHMFVKNGQKHHRTLL